MLGEICYTTTEKGDKGLAKTITTMVLLLAGSLLFGAAPRPADVAPDAEVWLCAGQSNMAMTLAETTSAAEEAARTAACDIRYHDFRTGAWLRVTPENAGGLSALAVQFATRRAEQTKRPQALVYVAAGGAPTEAFLARATMLRKDAAGAFLYPQLAKIASNTNTLDRNDDFPCLWCKREYPRRKNNAHEGALWAVSALHAALAATRSLPVTGVLWYQGESNATTCVAPDTALPRDYMEETLRAVLEELSPNHRTPVFMFGLPKMDRPWETYRAAQQKVCAETGHVFLDTFAAGLGTPGNVHPPDKRPFAELAVQAAAEHVKGVDLFRSETAYNDKIVKFYRIPAVCRTNKGTLLVAIDQRPDAVGDLNYHQPTRIVMRRSEDNGRTWGPLGRIHELPWTDEEQINASDPSLLVDRETGRVFCFWNAWEWVKDKGRYRFFVQHTDDDGRTWSAPGEITAQIYRPEWQGKPFVFISSGHGEQLKDGTLVHTVVWVNRHQVGLFGSEDHGRTWKPLGALVGPGDENKFMELKDGGWMINTRLPRGGGRGVHVSHDRGRTWETRIDETLADPACNAGLLRLSDGRLVFSNCNHVGGPRRNICVRTSSDEGVSWSEPRVVDPGLGEYSDLVELATGELGIVWEKGPGYRSTRFENLGRIP